MNSIITNNILSRQPTEIRQGKLPLWFIVFFIAVLVLLICSMGGYFYQKNVEKNTLKEQQQVLLGEKLTLLQQDDVINTNWLRTLNDRVKNVQGGVIWSSAKQQGLMYFNNLPKTREKQQYHLWIYDLAANADTRVSAAIFQHKKNGFKEFLIKMKPKSPVKLPYKFELVLDERVQNGKVVKQHPLLLAQP